MPTYYEYDGTEGNIDFVSNADLELRLSICASCPINQDHTCSACGCGLDWFAKNRSSSCPHHKWPEPSPVPEDQLFAWVED